LIYIAHRRETSNALNASVAYVANRNVFMQTLSETVNNRFPQVYLSLSSFVRTRMTTRNYEK